MGAGVGARDRDPSPTHAPLPSLLLGQAEDLKPESSWLLDRIGVGRGWRAADIGCGPTGILDMLSERMGPGGEVVGVEREPRFAAMARAEVERRGLPNVSIVEGDMLGSDSLSVQGVRIMGVRAVLRGAGPTCRGHTSVGAAASAW